MSIPEWHELFKMFFIILYTLAVIGITGYYALKLFAKVTYRLAHDQSLINKRIFIRKELMINV